MKRRPAAFAASVGLLTLALATSFPGSPAGAQNAPVTTTTAPEGPVSRIELVSQDPWTPLGGDVHLGLSTTNAPPGASVSATVHQPITTRREFDAAALGSAPSRPDVLSQLSVPLDSLAADASGTRTMVLGLQARTAPIDRERLNFVYSPGVYQLDVDLWDANRRTVATFRTMLVVAEEDRPPVAEPLQVAWVVPLVAPPSYLPNGDPDREVIAAFRPDGRLGRIALALDGGPDVQVTLAPTGNTMEAWAAAARTDPAIQATFEALLRVVSRRTVLEGTYVPIDLPALLENKNDLAIGDALTRGVEALTTTLPGVSFDRRTRLVRPAKPSALTRLHVEGVDRVVVDGDALESPPELKLTLAQPVTLEAPAVFGGEPAPVSALVADRGLQEILTSDLPPARQVQLLLGGLAVTAREAPAQRRVVTLVSPNEFDPRGATDWYSALLAGLSNNPYVQPVTVPTAFDTVPSDPAPQLAGAGTATSERNLVSGASPAPAVSAAKYRAHRDRLNQFSQLTRADDPNVTVGDRALLASVATGWPADVGPTLAQRHLQRIDKLVHALVAMIEVPDPRTITLTSKSGEIPLTFRNKTGSEIHVRAVLTSDKLFFPAGSVVDITLPPESTTVRVAVEARTSGTFPLHLEVTSADGQLPISQRRLEVRSTFVSTVGVGLMVSAAAFLALWWGIDWRRRRRRRRMEA